MKIETKYKNRREKIAGKLADELTMSDPILAQETLLGVLKIV